MSDDDPLLRNAWDATMSLEIPVKYLNCSWHTDRAFIKNIASKIRAPSKEKLAENQMLRVLIDETGEGESHKNNVKSFSAICQMLVLTIAGHDSRKPYSQ